jgi:hypothetical protein
MKHDRLLGRPEQHRLMKTETEERRLKCRWKMNLDRDRPLWPNATCRLFVNRAESHVNVPLVLGTGATAPLPKPWRKLKKNPFIILKFFSSSFSSTFFFKKKILIVCCSQLIMILTVLPGG